MPNPTWFNLNCFFSFSQNLRHSLGRSNLNLSHLFIIHKEKVSSCTNMSPRSLVVSSKTLFLGGTQRWALGFLASVIYLLWFHTLSHHIPEKTFFFHSGLGPHYVLLHFSQSSSSSSSCFSFLLYLVHDCHGYNICVVKRSLSCHLFLSSDLLLSDMNSRLGFYSRKKKSIDLFFSDVNAFEKVRNGTILAS